MSCHTGKGLTSDSCLVSKVSSVPHEVGTVSSHSKPISNFISSLYSHSSSKDCTLYNRHLLEVHLKSYSYLLSPGNQISQQIPEISKLTISQELAEINTLTVSQDLAEISTLTVLPPSV
jgi:hypothetical protein